MSNYVRPESISLIPLFNPFSSYKKMTIECGECGHTYKDKIYLKSIGSSYCPGCHTQNCWSMAELAKFIDEI